MQYYQSTLLGATERDFVFRRTAVTVTCALIAIPPSLLKPNNLKMQIRKRRIDSHRSECIVLHADVADVLHAHFWTPPNFTTMQCVGHVIEIYA